MENLSRTFWFPATIKRKSDDGLFDIEFEDGSRALSYSPLDMRLSHADTMRPVRVSCAMDTVAAATVNGEAVKGHVLDVYGIFERSAGADNAIDLQEFLATAEEYGVTTFVLRDRRSTEASARNLVTRSISNTLSGRLSIFDRNPR